MTSKSYFYDTRLQWAKRRRGTLRSEGLPELTISTPPEFNGEAGLWTPEHLLVAAAEACLMATFLGIAEKSQLAVNSYHSVARGKLEWVEGTGLRFTEIEIRPAVELEKIEDQARAQRVMDKAVKSCLIANSMAASIRVEPAFAAKAAEAA